MSQWSFTHNLYPLPHTWWYVDRWTEWYAKPSAVTPEPKKVTWVDASEKQHHDEIRLLPMTSMVEPARTTVNRFHEPHLRFEQPFEPFTWREAVRHRWSAAVSEMPGYGRVITWSDLAQIHRKCLKATKKTRELCDRLTRHPVPPLSSESSSDLTEPVCVRLEGPESPAPKRVIWPDKNKTYRPHKPMRKKSWREQCRLRERWRRSQKEREETRAHFLFRPGPGPVDRALIWLKMRFLKWSSRYPPATSPMKSCLKETKPRFQEPRPRPGPSYMEKAAPAGARYSSVLHVQVNRPDEA